MPICTPLRCDLTLLYCGMLMLGVCFSGRTTNYFNSASFFVICSCVWK
ncbi:hypothetical protein MUK42_33698 [Musa troglodytarum]|uniref:Uncharacterized protein n=1 Tax=Musa troglodytarum TaxID=320322 RepID=A0A9E7KAB1_9LILI|nr:hypothetical protein MUK42_33698 [Musa troglodytarum]